MLMRLVVLAILIKKAFSTKSYLVSIYAALVHKGKGGIGNGCEIIRVSGDVGGRGTRAFVSARTYVEAKGERPRA